MTALRLPYPPSANRLWRAVNGRQIKSKHYREWIEEAQRVIREQAPACVHGDYRLTLIATRPDRRARDIDNLIKPVSDALATAGVIANDCRAQSVLAAWSAAAPDKTAGVHVVLEAA